MNTKISVFFTSLLFGMLLQGIVFSQEVTSFSKSGAKPAITVSNYCQFLNAVAAADPDHLYDEKMGLSCSFLIVRMGEPGSYHYEVMNGKGEASIAFVSELHATHYLSWLQDPSLTFISNASSMAFDEQLQSTNLNFYLESISSVQQGTSVEDISEDINSLINWIGFLGILAGGSNVIRKAYFPEQERAVYHPEQDNHRLTPGTHLLPFEFQKLPDDICERVIFFKSEMPSESEARYEEQYEKTLKNFQIKDPNLAQQIGFWKEAHNNYWPLIQKDIKLSNIATAYQCFQIPMNEGLPVEAAHVINHIVTWESIHTGTTGHRNFLATDSEAETAAAEAYQDLHEIERSLSIEAHLVNTFDRAKAAMNSFKVFQKKCCDLLRNQERQNKSYLLNSTIKVNDILAQATIDLDALLKIAETCQAESEKEEIKEVPFIAGNYKMVVRLASQTVDKYGLLVQVMETKDASMIRTFLQERKQDQEMMAAKLALCNSLLKYNERIENCRMRLEANHDDDGIEALADVNFCFNQAIQTISEKVQIALKKGGDCCLQGAERRAANNLGDTENNLRRAFGEARMEGFFFEKAAFLRALGHREEADIATQEAEEHLKLFDYYATKEERDRVEALDLILALPGAVETFSFLF